MTPSYRIDWWLPLEGEPGEWAGFWDVATDAQSARDVALAVFDTLPPDGSVMITALVQGGGRNGRIVARETSVREWCVEEAALPSSDLDPSTLPPLGREDLECLTLRRCRDAMLVASRASLVDATMVDAVLEIVQQSFAGVGPAAELAATIAGSPSPGCDA